MQNLFSELVYLLLEARCVLEPAELERVASLRVSRVRVYRSRAKVGQVERADAGEDAARLFAGGDTHLFRLLMAQVIQDVRVDDPRLVRAVWLADVRPEQIGCLGQVGPLRQGSPRRAECRIWPEKRPCEAERNGLAGVAL